MRNNKIELNFKTKILFLILCSIGIIVLDQFTKQLVSNITFDLGWFEIISHSNYGILFGIALPYYLIIILSVIFLIILLALFFIYKYFSRIYYLGIALSFSGGFSNLIDRLELGFVRDFIDLHFLPVFNLADVTILLGVSLIVLGVLSNDCQRSKIKFKINFEESKKRLDIVLSNRFKQYSRRVLALAVKDGLVKINNQIETVPHKVVLANQIVQINLPLEMPKLLAEPINLDIIYKDKDLLVINKPAGMVMHPAGHHTSGTFVNALKDKFKNFYLVHRLDKDTSGIILVARNEKVRDFLSNLFKQRKIKKTYLALLQGKLMPKQAYIDMPIKRGKSGKFEVQSTGRSAKSFWQVKEYIKKFSLVEIQPKTGRTHQIRVHFSAMGHPVVGDEFYGVKIERLNRHFLHAHSLEFIDWQGVKRQFSIPLPKDLKEFLDNVKT